MLDAPIGGPQRAGGPGEAGPPLDTLPIGARPGRRSRAAVERAPQLGEVVVVVRGESRRPLGQREAAVPQVDAAARPLARRESAQQRRDLAAPALERGEGGAGVGAPVLTVLRPPIGIE